MLGHLKNRVVAPPDRHRIRRRENGRLWILLIVAPDDGRDGLLGARRRLRVHVDAVRIPRPEAL